VTVDPAALPLREVNERRGLHGRRLRAFAPESARILERELLWVVVLAAYAILILLSLPRMLAPDSWLAFLAGREIVEGGLPDREVLTAWSAGTSWIDQQWLGQLLLYGVFALGGLKLSLFVHAATLILILSFLLGLGRRYGASARSTAIAATGCIALAAASTALRTETLSYALFAVLLWLLFEDSRAPSNRVLLAIPLLALWANIHGSVVLASALVAMRGLAYAVAYARTRDRSRSSLLRVSLVAAPLACLASPYGLSLVDYYRRMLGNNEFQPLLAEWQPTSFPQQWQFFALALLGAWLVGRFGHVLTAYERVVLIVSIGVGLVAVRHVIWFALVAAVLLPRLIEAAWPYATTGSPRRGRVNAALAVSAVAALAVIAPATAMRSDGWYSGRYPDEARAVVASAVQADPSLKVFAHEKFADWLLFEEPGLAGRIAYDARFELLSSSRLRDLAVLGRQGENWRRSLRGYRLVVLDRISDGVSERALLRERGARLLYRDAVLSVVFRGGPPDAPSPPATRHVEA
jgi:hypothetical protein